ncbi:MAG: hybrid sensor histidine kinase/response regulator [Betaproteobacteria bacterium]
MKQRRVPLRRRLVLLTAAAIVPLAVVAAIALYALMREQRAQAERSGIEIARALSTAVDAELQRSLSVLEAIATATLLDQRDLARYHDLASRVVATRPTWASILVHDAQGNIVVDTARPFGSVVPPTSEPESLRQVLSTSQRTVGSLARGQMLRYAFPVRVAVVREGELRYVLTAVVKPDGILEVVDRQKLPPDWLVSVFDNRQQRVARSRQHDESLGGAPSPGLAKLMQEGRQEGTGVSEALEGDRVYTAFSRSQQTGWSVAIGIPAAYVEAGAWRSLATYGGGILLSLVIGALAALAIARSITRPIGELRAAAQALGRREAVVPPDTAIHEIRQVADSLIAAGDERARSDAEREQLLGREKQARSLAETANRSKDEFLAMLGHELRNPLGTIANARRLLGDPRADAATREQAQSIIARQVDHLSRMTDDLLDAARAMTGKIVLQRQPLELADAAAQVIDVRKPAQKVVRLLEPVWISGDPTRIDQIVGNLLANAMRYTPPTGTITVSVRGEGRDAVLRVADDGAGMPAELVERVFDPFVQGERSLDRSYGGLGIGLTVVRRLAELHGGSARAQSAGPGRGSLFTVTFPAIATPQAPRAHGTAPEPRPRRRILVVEDNEDAREMLRRLLELDGHSVRTVRDGEAALEAVRTEMPEFALVDLGLPGIDGFEVARRLRSLAEEGKRPVLVAVTGYGLPEDRKRTLAAGFDYHLVKPVDAGVLAEILHK